PKSGSEIEMLAWSRANMGYDICISLIGVTNGADIAARIEARRPPGVVPSKPAAPATPAAVAPAPAAPPPAPDYKTCPMSAPPALAPKSAGSVATSSRKRQRSRHRPAARADGRRRCRPGAAAGSRRLTAHEPRIRVCAQDDGTVGRVIVVHLACPRVASRIPA